MDKKNVNTGIISLSAKLAEPYSEELMKHNMNVMPLTMENFEQYVDQLDAVIIRENAEQDVRHTCQLLVKIKESSDAFVWVFSPNTPVSMRIVYLQLGAVGVISDDCKADELQLIISNSVYKRKGMKRAVVNTDSDQVDEKGKKKFVELIPRNSSIRIDGMKEIPLTKLEYRAIDFLYRNMNAAVTYQEIFETVWEKEFDNKNYRVANLIFHLREKIEKDASNPILIQTVRSKGYMLVG
ncbi:winged helix-turn-helix domain-containing protein [Enterococcus sp. BWR-S5]|uniref:winged helix-turn-helix domain-containing protein n=1 Tax=Enterococcus sp. BWR-S5 TaxID=2787714 RepID=UPI001922D1B6|nr:winged helix-turn-helix domain-containing protein [Enterococcus sp. BWR-S5]MBL1227378.1 winged helix-turn-helix domain-containing protein [Enterococcus sp. BWR-S5]